MPVIAEMKIPSKFPKALFISQGFLVVCYITFGVVMYVYCGQYVASPSLASAGGTLELVAYGIAVPGFMMTSTLWIHVAAKFVRVVVPASSLSLPSLSSPLTPPQLLVRILRDSKHLQDNSVTHWVTWLYVSLPVFRPLYLRPLTFSSSTIGLTIIAFILAEAIPFFNYILGLIGSFCCSPTCVRLPALLPCHPFLLVC